jgi:hypothetical protein
MDAQSHYAIRFVPSDATNGFRDASWVAESRHVIRVLKWTKKMRRVVA